MKTFAATLLVVLFTFYACKKDNNSPNNQNNNDSTSEENNNGNQITTLNDGLIAYYPFNGNANNSINANFNGIIYGASLAVDRFNHADSAFQFNGQNSYIEIPNSVGFTGSNYTYSLWLKINQMPGPGQCQFVMEVGPPDLNIRGHSLGINNQYPSTNPTTGWSVNSFNSDGSRINFQTGTLPDLEIWYNITVVRNDTAVIIYKNGERLTYNLSNGIPSEYDNPENFYVGARMSLASGFFFNGEIDDIRIYNRALTEDEIKALTNLKN